MRFSTWQKKIVYLSSQFWRYPLFFPLGPGVNQHIMAGLCSRRSYLSHDDQGAWRKRGTVSKEIPSKVNAIPSKANALNNLSSVLQSLSLKCPTVTWSLQVFVTRPFPCEVLEALIQTHSKELFLTDTASIYMQEKNQGKFTMLSLKLQSIWKHILYYRENTKALRGLWADQEKLPKPVFYTNWLFPPYLTAFLMYFYCSYKL